MDAAVQGSTGGKRFAMKAQRPVRDGQGIAPANDPAMGEDGLGMCGRREHRGPYSAELTPVPLLSEPFPRYNAEGSSSTHTISPEPTSNKTSPRLRVHAIPSTIHENIKEEADGHYLRRSASPRTEPNTHMTLTNGTIRPQGQRRSDSPSNTASLPRRETSSLHDYESARPSPEHSGSTLQPNGVNKENRNPYYAAGEGKQELTSVDSKTWLQQDPTGGAPRLQYSAEIGTIPNYRSTDPTYPDNPVGFPPDDRQYATQSSQTPHQIHQRHPAPTVNNELPLITPTIGRSIGSADRRMGEPPLPQQLPPFVAYDAYQQAMTPMANGYPQMQAPQQPPPTVSQLPAGRKAFTVRRFESLCIVRSPL